MTLKGEFNDLRKDIALIQSDLVDIKEDLKTHMKRTALLEAKQDIFEATMESFRCSAKEVESSAIIIKKVWRPIICILAILAGLAGTNQVISILQQLF